MLKQEQDGRSGICICFLYFNRDRIYEFELPYCVIVDAQESMLLVDSKKISEWMPKIPVLLRCCVVNEVWWCFLKRGKLEVENSRATTLSPSNPSNLLDTIQVWVHISGRLRVIYMFCLALNSLRGWTHNDGQKWIQVYQSYCSRCAHRACFQISI